MSDIVTRLWGNTGDKYPGFQNMNSEAAAEITRLREELAAWKAEAEAGRGLDVISHETDRDDGWHERLRVARHELEDSKAATDAIVKPTLPPVDGCGA